jgi:integrase
MAYFAQMPNGKWRAFVVRKGYPSQTKVFRLKTDAEYWARQIEAKLEGGYTYKQGELRRTTVGDLLEAYRQEIVPRHKGRRWEDNRCRAMMRCGWATLNLTQDIQGALQQWCQDRVTGTGGQSKVSAATVHRDLNLLGAVFRYAIKHRQLTVPEGNPVHRLSRPQIVGGERDRIWSAEDLELVLTHLGFEMAEPPSTVRSYLGWVLLVARLTGLRLSNVVGIKVEQIDLARRCIHFEANEVKNGQQYDCPLSTTAAAVIAKLLEYRRGQKRLFVSSVASIGTLLRREIKAAAEKHPQLAGLRVHDLRHTWTTEMVPKVGNVLTAAKIAGRKTTKSLARYYHPKAEDLAKLLD